MRYPLMMLAAVALFLAAQAEMVSVAASPAFPDAISSVPATVPMVCPVSAAALPQPCPVVASTPLSSHSMVLVLGTQEYYALSNAPTRHLGWYDNSQNYSSYFTPGNPMTSYHPSPVVTRHGNPFLPYHQVSASLRPQAIASTTRMVTLPASLSDTDRAALVTLSNRYRTMTTEQAMALGYTAQGTCVPGTGQLYLNTAMTSNPVDPMRPAGFYFGADGRVLAAVYLTPSSTPMVMFGQPTAASTITPGAQQMTVWIFEPNPNGLFASTNPNTQCSMF